jgi:hypothetical protein
MNIDPAIISFSRQFTNVKRDIRDLVQANVGVGVHKSVRCHDMPNVNRKNEDDNVESMCDMVAHWVQAPMEKHAARDCAA